MLGYYIRVLYSVFHNTAQGCYMASKSQDGTILINQGPWGGRPGNDPGKNNEGGGNKNGDKPGGNPWGQRPRGGGGGGGGGNDPDLDDMLRQAQDKFKNTFGGKKPSSSMEPGRAFSIMLGLLAVVWLGSGFYTVQPEEHAAILTFGKKTDIKDQAGLGYRLPYPIQEVIKVDVMQNRQLDIGFQGRGAVTTDKPGESSMLTGDENIVKIHFSVFWSVTDLSNFLFEISEPQEETVMNVAESSMREIIGRTQIQKALTEGRGDIENKAKELMQKTLDSYKTGVTVKSVQLLSVDPPDPVVDAFNDVQRARTDRERLKNEADAYKNNVVPIAKGEREKLIREAEGYKEATIAKAQGDADRFNSVYKAYAEAKDITQKRLYLETMQEILKNSRKVITGDAKGNGVLPLLQLDKGGMLPPQPR